jgi:ribosomal protein S6
MSDEVKKDPSRFEVSYLERNEGSADMRAAVVRHGGTVVQERPLEKVRLAYPIEKQQYAFLGCMEFTVDPSALAELQVELRLNKELLRALVHRATAPAAGAEGSTQSAPGAAVSPLSPRAGSVGSGRPARSSRPKPEPVLTNEALEKKIEEMK